MNANSPLPISVCLVAGNEAHRIARTLESVQGWTSEIILAIDDKVTDGTDKIAETYGAKSFQPAVARPRGAPQFRLVPRHAAVAAGD